MIRKIIIISLILFIGILACKSKEKLSSPDHFIIKKNNIDKVKVNTPVDFQIEIIPTDGFEMEVEAPIKLTFNKENNPDIEFEKSIYTKDDLLNKDIKKPIFKGKFTPLKANDFTVKGELSFVVCTSSICEPKKTEVEFKFLAE